MNGPDHHHFAEQLAQEAYNRLGQGDEQSATAWAAVAQVHATLALAAATTTTGTASAGSQASAEVGTVTGGAIVKPAREEEVARRRHRKEPVRKIGQGPVAEQPPGRHPAP